jgi:hypothetical protein
MSELGLLFPVGGRVEPVQMVGRVGDVQDVVELLFEHVHVTLSGARRIGKTTVCNAACERLRDEHQFIVLEVEAPEQSTAAGFCELIAARYARASLTEVARRGVRVARPILEHLTERLLGVTPDLSSVTDPDQALLSRRAALELPRALASETGRKVVLFADELQRAVNYADGIGLINDLVDIYAGNREVVVLVDGSDERTLEQLIGEPYNLGKLTKRLALTDRIPFDQWRAPLRDRFEQAKLTICDARLQRVLAFGAEHPYHTMCAALEVALKTRALQLDEINDFALDEGLQAARARIDEDS